MVLRPGTADEADDVPIIRIARTCVRRAVIKTQSQSQTQLATPSGTHALRKHIVASVLDPGQNRGVGSYSAPCRWSAGRCDRGPDPRTALNGKSLATRPAAEGMTVSYGIVWQAFARFINGRS